MPGRGMPDLDKNRALAEWLEWQLRQVRGRNGIDPAPAGMFHFSV